MGHRHDDDRINGIDLAALGAFVDAVKADPTKGEIGFRVLSRWAGQTRSEAEVQPIQLGGQEIARRFTIAADEPAELLGADSAANPQELLMAALNACMMVGYVVGAAADGIALSRLEIETEGALDLRGFLGIDPTVKPGYETMRYTIRIAGDGTREQFARIHETVMRTSPNYFNVANAIQLDASLEMLEPVAG